MALDPSFSKPVLPKTPNVIGYPQPPSGLHTPVAPEIVFTPVGAVGQPSVPTGPAPNIHSSLGARLLGRVAALLGRGQGSEL